MGRNTLAGPLTAGIAAELRAQKARHGWTVDDIAERSGLPRSTVNRALQGKSALAVEVLLPVCAAMRLDPAKVLRQAERRATPEAS